jgi:hypothetical protein
MPDSGSLATERRVQPMFMKINIFSGLAMFLTVMAFDSWLKTVPSRSDRPARLAAVSFVPVTFDQAGFAPLRLAGAWEVEVDDPRFGGVSALAVNGDQLLALTDSGTLVRLPRPGSQGQALVRDLLAGPGTPRFKSNRDSEALARDPAGRGWWVAFEQWHQLWLYDRDFRRPLARIDLGRRRWSDNRGVEAMSADGRGLRLFPEPGDEWLRIDGPRIQNHRLVSRYGYISDAVRLPDGRLLLVARKFGLAGIAKRLVAVEGEGSSPKLRSVARLGLGPIDNVEAIAAEPLGPGGTRLWLMTDNDFRRGQRTLLVALDLPPER